MKTNNNRQQRHPLLPALGGLLLMLASAGTALAQTTIDTAITSNGGDVRSYDGSGTMYSTIGEPTASDSINTIDNGTTWTGFWQTTPIGPVGGVKDDTPMPPDAAAGITGTAPEPFTTMVDISVTVAVTGHVHLAVYDITGAFVGTLLDARVEAGNHRVSWKPENVAPGCYMVTLAINGQDQSARLIRYMK
ncbi:MAG TPA: hypothetical protein VHI13_03725 [Candidatus Kapabacteria bacterium]|nr:hypothetical protein [Candidatus Kapabacteria bacterium]